MLKKVERKSHSSNTNQGQTFVRWGLKTFHGTPFEGNKYSKRLVNIAWRFILGITEEKSMKLVGTWWSFCVIRPEWQNSYWSLHKQIILGWHYYFTWAISSIKHSPGHLPKRNVENAKIEIFRQLIFAVQTSMPTCSYFNLQLKGL